MAMTRKQRRLVTIGLAGIVLAIAATLILTAAKDKIVFFYGPTEVKAMEIREIRVRSTVIGGEEVFRR